MSVDGFAPTGRQLAELAKAAKCHVDVLKAGDGKVALDAIVVAAQAAVQPAPQTEEKITQDGSPGACWKCGHANQWETQRQETQTIKRCTACGSKYITPRF